MSVLQEQIGGLASETEDGELKPKKFKYVLEQDYLKELLQQIRGQQASITLLLQTYQSESLTKLEQSMQDYNIVLQHMAGKGLSLWRGIHSSGQYQTPTTIVGNSETDSVFELSSIITDTRFDFDDQVINSKAYRRALGNLRQAQIDPNRLPINENRPEQTLQSLEELEVDHLEYNEAASSNLDPSSTFVIPLKVPEHNLANLELENLPAKHHSEDSTRTPFQADGGEGVWATAPEGRLFNCPLTNCSKSYPRQGYKRLGHFERHMQTCHTAWLAHDPATYLREIPSSSSRQFDALSVRRRPVPAREKSADSEIARDQDADIRMRPNTESLDQEALSWQPGNGNPEETHKDDDQGPAQPQHLNASTLPEIAVFEPPSSVSVRPIEKEDTDSTALEAVLDKAHPEDDLKEHVTKSNSVVSLSPQSSPAESPDSGKAVATTPTPKRQSSRFQRFMSALLQPSPSYPEVIRRKLVIVGDPYTGKSCLLIAFSKGTFPTYSPATVFEDYVADVEVDGKHVELALWDTAGVSDYDRLRPLSYPDTHGVLITFSLVNPDSLDNIYEKWISEVLHFCQGLPIVLVGTHKDVRDNNGPNPYGGKPDPVSSEQGEEMRKKIGAWKYMECSAKTNEGVREVFEAATRGALLTRKKEKKKR
ncbi:hypothetical protein H2200_012686 [Cladophialophora chaetospira]|uniref:Uncharacterized protein n=1 Tax=Cladophialophora chaetospira TaxID=386627 RepID=A0AA38WXD1_9EURO|nr:hypothetical protein H2200_012686 [Cladophialophora chaetospira]